MKKVDLPNQILKVLTKRYRRDYKKSPPLVVVNKMKERIALAFWENRIVYQLSSEEKVIWFFIYATAFRGDFNQTMFLVTDTFISSLTNKGVENQLLKAINIKFSNIKRSLKIKKGIINIDREDHSLKQYFSQQGELTSIELLGKVSDGLHFLSKNKTDNKYKIRRLKKSDINKCIKLDIESHIKDPTSRMRDRFRQPDVLDFQRPFYQRLAKNKAALLASDGKNILGVIGFFIHADIKHAMVACIFVNHQHKGKGVAQFLYLNALMYFKKMKCQYYLGSTTTKGVLELAKKMNRNECCRAFVI
jgi:predicted GNAT family acetyltransferase